MEREKRRQESSSEDEVLVNPGRRKKLKWQPFHYARDDQDMDAVHEAA